MKSTPTQQLPQNWGEREALREKGQFWTPDWVADSMVAWVVEHSSKLFDPAVGAGAFLRAAKRLAATGTRSIDFSGFELHTDELNTAVSLGLTNEDLREVIEGDFLATHIERTHSAIVANPPYIRHHRLANDYKELLKTMGKQLTGKALDGRAGIHVYFLIKSLTTLAINGRLAFILPADICEGKYAHNLWNWISENFRINAVITFAPEATPFPRVDTNPVIILISKQTPKSRVWWTRVLRPDGVSLGEWIRQGLGEISDENLEVHDRDLEEGLQTGLSRAPIPPGLIENSFSFGEICRVMRGIATASNEFFFMTSEQVESLGLSKNNFVRAVGRTRDVTEMVLKKEAMQDLDDAGRPTFLLSLGKERLEHMPVSLQEYIKRGESLGVSDRPLIRQRAPWYKMETRKPPTWLFAYLGRRNCRFVLNEAGVAPLTCFLCVYEKRPGLLPILEFTKVLNDERTIANLALVGKSYGGGAVKIEPRGLEKLRIPLSVLRDYKIDPPVQLGLDL